MPALRKPTRPQELVAFDAKGLRRQVQFADAVGIEQALEGQIVDGQHRGGTGLAGEGQVGWGKAGLPVVAVHEVGAPATDPAEADVRRYPREQAVAAEIVRPVAPVGAQIGIARATVEMRRIQHEQIHAGTPRRQQPDRPPHGVGQADGLLLMLEPRDHGRIAGHQRAHLDTERGQSAG